MKLQEQLVARWEGLSPAREPGTFLPRAVAERAAVPSPRALVRENARALFLAADGQTPTLQEQEVMLGSNDLLDVNFLERSSLVCQAIGRIEAKSGSGRVRATGFIIAPGLLMTNHHVLPDRETAATASVEFGYRYNVAGELGQTTRFELDAESFFVADERLDYAVVAVREKSFTEREAIRDFGYLRLHPGPGKVRLHEFVTIIQHPDGNPLQIALRENQVTRSEEQEHFIQYEADTAHGSSGAPVFNDSLQVAALHSGGRIKRTASGEYVLSGGGGSTTSLEGLSESDVVWEANAGIRVSHICADLQRRASEQYPSHALLLQQAMGGGDLLARAVVAARTGTPAPDSPVTPQPDAPTEDEHMPDTNPNRPDTRPAARPAEQPSGRDGVTLPLLLRVTLEDPRAAGSPVSFAAGVGAPARPQESLLEREASKMQIPIIYDGLEEREGYDPAFLELDDGAAIDLPRLTSKGKQVAAPLLDGDGYVLRYHKFSLVMHKGRRLALFTASNVDWRRDRRLVNGKKPTRDELTGIFEERVAEQWVTDERISARHQLPDVFFTEDRAAFDKGHLVRRDDVCWGDSFEDIQKANGDTYHVTNCSPQIKAFNQAMEGDFNWGDFENEVQRQTKAEKVIIFSGPVLDSRDRWFRGRDERGPVRVQVPSRYWKIVVAKGDNGPQAFGFIFKQDVRGITEAEFAVSPEWRHASVRISDIAQLLRGWVDLSDLKPFDQFE